MTGVVVALQQVVKRYSQSNDARPALDNVEFAIEAGEFVALVGRSGSGKSTLLNLLAGLDQPSSGAVKVRGQDLGRKDENELAQWRGRSVGVVFQFFQLVPTLTILENVLLAMDFVGVVPTRERKLRALNLLATVGVEDQGDKLPATLSGGQQQRAAIARALANDPEILIADEPTGNLDSATAEGVLALFERLVAEGRTVLVVTHDEAVASRAHRIVRLHDGRVVEDSRRGAGA